MLKRFAAVATMVVGVSAVAFAQTPLPLDTFEGYPDQNALDAVWLDDTAGVTLQTDGGASGNNYVRTPTTAARKFRSIALTATDANPVVMEFSMRVPSVVPGVGRTYVQISNAVNGTEIVSIGVNNNVSTPKWLARVNGGGAPSGYQALTSGPDRVANVWTKLKAVIQARDVTFYVDDVAAGTLSRTTSDFPEFNQIKIGSNLSSPITADYDDIQVYQAIASVKDWAVY